MRFQSLRHGVSGILDVHASGDLLEETKDEAEEYDLRTKEEIRWKLNLERGEPSGHKSDALQDEQQDGNTAEECPEPVPSSEITLQGGDESDQDVPQAIIHKDDRPTFSQFPVPSFRPSGMSHSTPKPLKPSINSTFPQVPTPTFVSTPQLPRPPIDTVHQAAAGPSTLKTIETPVHVPSPIDTPGAFRPVPGSGEGRGRRDDPATPVPLGIEKFKLLKGKKDFQTLTKHFEVFSKQTERQKRLGEEAGRVFLKGKGKAVEVATLGGKVFEGLRFCFPPELGNTSKQKTHWDIIAKRGGAVTLQADTAITHVIYDTGRSAQALARQLGLQTLSELPEGTVCVRYDWVVHCLRAGKLVDTGPYLSFPKNVLTRSISVNTSKSASRMSDITDLLRANSVSISRKRGPTASDSETESPAKQPRPPMQLQSRPSRQPVINKHTSDWTKSSGVHTEHDAPKGPGWLEVAEYERDGLDDMISGLKNGSVPEETEEQIMLEEGNDTEERPSSPLSIPKGLDKNPSRMAEGFICGQSHDGSPSDGPNDWLAKKFDEMHDLYQGAQHKNSFQVRGYQKAAGVMRRTKWPITSGKDALKIKGIGQGMADRIDEWINGGQGRQFYETNDQVKVVQIFKDIYGVGRARANEFYHQGARTIEDLKSGRFDLTEGQRIGLALYDDLKQRIPRAECKEIYDIVRAETLKIDPKIEIEIMGSYRRGSETSGDVDFLITRDDSDGLNHSGVMRKLIQKLMMRGIITHELSDPHDWDALEAKWMGVCRLDTRALHRRIDILCIPYEQWGAALLYFTGNDIFNRSLRLYARKKGYSLNQRGLYKDVIRGIDGLKITEGHIIASRTEQEIFDILGIRWRAPQHRRP